MACYIVSRLKVTDPQGMRQYQQDFPPLVESFGGKYLVRGGPVEALEGSWDHDRLVIMEFPSKEAAQAWYHSAAYRPFIELRRHFADADILMADAIDG